MQKRTRWVRKKVDEELAREISKELGISHFLSKVLISRGVDTPAKVERFLNPSLSDADSPFSFPDMKKASHRLAEAVMKGEVIGIFSDADADGISAAAILTNFLIDAGVPRKKIVVRVPSRDREGYGLTKEFVDEVKKRGGRLIITADCGIRNHEEIMYAKMLGVDVIVCDHHHMDYSLPEHAHSILHPETIKESGNSAKYLSGAGVSFELVAATRQTLKKAGKDLPRPRKYLDVVSIGTIGDMVPLLGDNRIFVKYGISLLRDGQGNLGLSALIKKVDIPPDGLTSWDIQMRVVPRINSSGRAGKPEVSFQLLTEQNIKKIESISDEIENMNTMRKEIVEGIINDIIFSDEIDRTSYTLTVWGKDWPEGMVGLVASRLLEITGKVTCVLSLREDIARGSLRSPEFINIMGVLDSLSHLLMKYGGHSQAAGVVIHPSRLHEFKDAFEEQVRKTIGEEIPEVILEYDDVVLLDSVSNSEIRELLSLEPFGEGNPQPILLLNCDIVSSKVVGKDEKHVKMLARTQDGYAEIIAFNKVDEIGLPVGRHKIIAKLRSTRWNQDGFDFELVEMMS